MAEKKDALITLVGAENVSDDLKTREEFSRDNSFCYPKLPALVVRPRQADDVQAVVQWANRTKTPLVPVSSGAPHFRGDSVPGADGALIVDLSGMNRIIMVDRKNRVALVEPGVTYGTLQSELARNGMRLSMPLMPRATKSVLGSLLEREPILNPRYAWSLNEPLRCIEVVMGNGEMFRTGELAGAGVSTATREEARLVPIEELLEQRKKIQYSALYQYGPGQFNFHKLVSAAQGTMGIVTWASLRCEVLPRAQKFFLVPSENLQDIIGFAYKLLRIRFHDELLLLNRSSLAAVLGADAQQAAGLREQFPPWVLVLGLTGRDILPEERVAFMEKDVTAIAQQFSLRLETAIPGATGEQVAQTVLSPSPAPYWKLRAGGNCQDIFFLTTLNRVPEFVKTMQSLAQAAGYPLSDLGMYVQPTHLGKRCHVEFSLPYDPESATEVARVQSLFDNASNKLSEQGAFFSRPYGSWAALAYARNTEHARLTKKLKDIFDPNTVLNPGKLCF